MKDYYKILGIKHDATSGEIKEAYYELAHEHHPDKGGNEEKFKEINEAYQVLSNQKKKAQYDKYGRVFEEGSEDPFSGFGFNKGFGSNSGFRFNFDQRGSDINLEDVISEIFGGRSDGFSPFRNRGIDRGKDIQVDIEIPLQETLNPQKKTINILKYITCPRCGGSGAEPGTKTKECVTCRGTGKVQQIKRTVFGTITQSAVCPECHGQGYVPEKPCNVCHGEGRIKKEQKIQITIPAGIDNNQILRLNGKGEAGKRGRPSGDLYIRIFVKSNPSFQRKGDDLYTTIPIDFSQAVLGDKIKISALNQEKITLNIPSGTSTGDIFKIKARGIPHFSRLGRGNIYAKLKIRTPKKLSRKQKELLKKLREEGM